MAESIVAIVGRPNVGKSTLFNRLTGRRQAIVDDRPGVTRDRNYGNVEWNGTMFVLVDTGGYMPESEDLMDKAIKEQVEIAMEDADVLIFLVDGQTGITETDLQIARMLHRSQRHVILTVNKIDTQDLEVNASEFYNLGLGDPVPVSAMKGRGSGDFLDIIVERVKKHGYEEKVFDGIQLAIIGKENVGKSSLVNTLLNQQRSIVTDIPGTTRDSVDSVLKYKNKNYLLIDTAGLKKRAKIKENILFYSTLRTQRSIQRADVVIYMVDVNEGISRQDIAMLGEVVRQRKGLMLLLNKWDLIEKDDKTIYAYQEEISMKLGQMQFIPQMFVSVLEKKRLYKALDKATAIYEDLRRRIPTSELNDFIAATVQKTMPPAVKGKEIKITYVTQIPARYPLFAFFCNHPKLITENYRRFLENRIREQYSFEGVPIVLSFRKK
ncbi:MAG: ribosome biogenesis GTPase Der [Calditrichaeota bacterium]|nr:MAG: ribosome biogenesis GTPase Der [Calditrichota bacterium]